MPAKAKARDAQADFLVMSIVAAVTPTIEAKCGELSKRDLNTLKRRIEKAVRQFVNAK
jgi:hypothetical protein